MSDFSYNIVRNIAVLSQRGNWNLELNLISWGGRPATYDLRKWSPDHSKMSKGISLSKSELDALAEYLSQTLIPTE